MNDLRAYMKRLAESMNDVYTNAFETALDNVGK